MKCRSATCDLNLYLRASTLAALAELKHVFTTLRACTDSTWVCDGTWRLEDATLRYLTLGAHTELEGVRATLRARATSRLHG